MDVFEVVHWVQLLLPRVVLLSEEVDHVIAEQGDDDDGNDVRKDHFALGPSHVQDRGSVHRGHSLDQMEVVRGHRVSSHIQRHHDHGIEECDDGEKDR